MWWAVRAVPYPVPSPAPERPSRENQGPAPQIRLFRVREKDAQPAVAHEASVRGWTHVDRNAVIETNQRRVAGSEVARFGTCLGQALKRDQMFPVLIHRNVLPTPYGPRR